MYAKVESLGLNGLDAFSVTVEADISTGLPRFDIVGLPDMAVRESRERGLPLRTGATSSRCPV
jgi:magnesium chelatase family protein